MRPVHVASSLVLSILLACSGQTTAPPPIDPCECGPRVCGFLCTRQCGVCEDDGVCSEDGLYCTPSLPFGAPCHANIQCGTGRICLTANGHAPNGYCSRRCGEDDPCPNDGVCALGPEGENVCHAKCDPAGGAPQCRSDEGYPCLSAGYCRACAPVCSTRACGDDGCGGSCGQCLASGVVCDGGACANVYGERLPMPKPTSDLAALEDDGTVLLIGGREPVRYPSGLVQTRGVSRFLRWDPDANRFTTLVELPEPIARPNAAMLGGVAYVAGGTIDSADVDAPEAPATGFYVQSNGNWKKKTSEVALLPEASLGGTVVAANDKLYLFPGDVGGTLSKATHVYDPPPQDRWFPGPARPSARTLAVAVADGQRVFVIGGWDGTRAVGTVEILGQNGLWTTSDPLPEPTAGATATVAGGRIFVFGGWTGAGQGDPVAYVQTIDLTTLHTTLLGTTYNGLTGQAVATTRQGTFLFGASELSVGVPVSHSEVVLFKLPAP